MELVYLWVEKYKNIENQGFNFSPKFVCEFDGENLTITENKDYVSIFPYNINVNAIVGENGSGKSSLLVGITNHKAIFKINNEYFSRGFDLKKINSNLKIIENDKDILKHVVYIDFDLIKFPSMKDIWDYDNLNIYNRNLYKNIENSTIGDINFSIPKYIHNFYNLIMEHIISFESKLFFFNPQKILFSDYLHEVHSSHPNSIIVNQLFKQVPKHPFSKEKFLLFLFLNKSWQKDSEFPIIETIENLLTYEEIIIEHAKHFKIENKQNIYNFFDELNNLTNNTQMPIEDFITFYEKHKEAFLNLINIAYLQINFIDTLQREYSDLSQGERKLFTEMLMIFDAIKKSEKNDMLIVLDEPDLTLHPDWQKKYINEMIKLLSNFPEKKFHLIITSHSPFILSDIPKENVIFLEKYKEDDEKVKNENQKVGNCKNTTKDIDIKTFGANIHTLLANGFFMRDGLMGEFAKSKINEIKDFYDANKNLKKDNSDFESKKDEFEEHKEYFRNIQKIIGEPFLQTIIKNYLDELEILFNGKKEFLDKEIERLKELRKSLNDKD